MVEPILAAQTETNLRVIIADPPHAVLLTGPMGIGKRTVAEWLIEQLDPGPHRLDITPEKDKQTIGIEAVRSLERFTALKVAGDRPVDRIVYIADAEQLTHEAQNAMLKTLEEPPAGTLLLFTSASSNSLLPTIRSRLQTIEIIPPDASSVEAGLPQNSSLTPKQIMAMSAGLPGLAHDLANGDSSQPTVVAATTARSLLQATTFERLAMVDRLSKDKRQAVETLDMLMRMAHSALAAGSSRDRWQKVLTASYEAKTALDTNAQPKLTLTKYMLNL